MQYGELYSFIFCKNTLKYLVFYTLKDIDDKITVIILTWNNILGYSSQSWSSVLLTNLGSKQNFSKEMMHPEATSQNIALWRTKRELPIKIVELVKTVLTSSHDYIKITTKL